MSIDESIQELKDRVRSKPEYITEGYFADITEQLLAYMEKNEITKRELAEKMEVSQSRVSQFFNDNSNVTLKTLAKIARALGVSWTIKLNTYPEGTTPRGADYNEELFSPGAGLKLQVPESLPDEEDAATSQVSTYIQADIESEGNTLNVEIT